MTTSQSIRRVRGAIFKSTTLFEDHFQLPAVVCEVVNRDSSARPKLLEKQVQEQREIAIIHDKSPSRPIKKSIHGQACRPGKLPSQDAISEITQIKSEIRKDLRKRLRGVSPPFDVVKAPPSAVGWRKPPPRLHGAGRMENSNIEHAGFLQEWDNRFHRFSHLADYIAARRSAIMAGQGSAIGALGFCIATRFVCLQ
ncbi:hypothetical protein K470DRAFT_258291 [Piedraia hortae CBS 480.64]|uniref:Uncharacterized protein n=1 Tax=Piedraia hortae CBS 480.64 TaxID=1314780 RepID=A0A6A7BY45_9PEZI|nr:hypothetical protein K470DRAFT_258291 [Piedraia hortae CBS 480.64]